MEEAQVFDFFNMIAEQLLPGDKRDSVRPVYLNSRVLTVASLSSFATAELKQKEAQVISFINEKMAGRAIRKISFLT